MLCSLRGLWLVQFLRELCFSFKHNVTWSKRYGVACHSFSPLLIQLENQVISIYDENLRPYCYIIRKITNNCSNARKEIKGGVTSIIMLNFCVLDNDPSIYYTCICHACYHSGRQVFNNSYFNWLKFGISAIFSDSFIAQNVI